MIKLDSCFKIDAGLLFEINDGIIKFLYLVGFKGLIHFIK